MPYEFRVLERQTPWRGQVGCTWALALFLMVLGSAILYPTWTHRNVDDPTGGAVVGGAFALVGLIMAYSAVHQSLAIRTPEPEVAIDAWPLKPGQAARLRIRQPGPVRLRSMSGRLICEVRESYQSRQGKTEYRSKYPCQEQFFRSEAVSVPAGGHFETTAELKIPEGATPSGSDGGGLTIRWRIELWGRVRMWPDFMHPYEVNVVA